MDEDQRETEHPASPSRRVSTPLMVGSMAAMIMAVVFVVAIIRGGSGEPPPVAPRQAGTKPGLPGPAAGTPADGELTAGWPRGPVPREGVAFRWDPVDGVREYQVTVYDPLMKVVWISPRLAESSVEPPEKIREFMRNGTPYRWKVVGFTGGGGTLESASVTFRLVE